MMDRKQTLKAIARHVTDAEHDGNCRAGGDLELDAGLNERTEAHFRGLEPVGPHGKIREYVVAGFVGGHRTLQTSFGLRGCDFHARNGSARLVGRGAVDL